jgi:hypothetical protein
MKKLYMMVIASLPMCGIAYGSVLDYILGKSGAEAVKLSAAKLQGAQDIKREDWRATLKRFNEECKVPMFIRHVEKHKKDGCQSLIEVLDKTRLDGQSTTAHYGPAREFWKSLK